MNTEQLEVNGTTIRKRTSLFNTQTEEVLWFNGTQNDYVQLETVDEAIEMPESEFRAHIINGEIQIESQPPGYTG